MEIQAASCLVRPAGDLQSGDQPPHSKRIPRPKGAFQLAVNRSLVLEFINTVTYFRPSGIHGLEARATLTGSRGTGFQPVKLRSLLHSAPVAEYVTVLMKPCT
jgi:hypothetical protein